MKIGQFTELQLAGILYVQVEASRSCVQPKSGGLRDGESIANFRGLDLISGNDFQDVVQRAVGIQPASYQ